MEDSKRDNILYKPQIAPQRHYESNATFEEPNIELPVNDETEDTDVRREIIDDLTELREMIEFLPDGLQFISGTIDKLLQREKVIEYEESLPNPYDCTIEEKPVQPIEYSDCQSDCFDDCGSNTFENCVFDCETDCTLMDCETDCHLDCQLDCGIDCETDCHTDCALNCETDCETDCGIDNCAVDCQLDCETDCSVFDCKSNCGINNCSENCSTEYSDCDQDCYQDCYQGKGLDCYVNCYPNGQTDCQHTNCYHDGSTNCRTNNGTNCDSDCYEDCYEDCHTNCYTDCETDCYIDRGVDCYADCESNCYEDCSVNCGTNCVTNCTENDCRTDCYDDCENDCGGENCYNNCRTDCRIDRPTDCKGNCTNNCESDCDNGCTFLDCSINDCDCITENDCDCLDCVLPPPPPENCGGEPGDCVVADCHVTGYPPIGHDPTGGGFSKIENKKTKYITYIDSIPQTELPPDLTIPSLFPSPTNITINLVAPRTLVQIARDSYKNDTIELHKYYIQRLQTVLQHYFQQMMTIMQEANVSNITHLTQEFDGDKVVVPNPMLAHLRDAIVRSQIGRNQKERMMQKVHSTDNTLIHMRAWHAAEKERERYYDEVYGDSGTYLDSSSNELLRKSRSTYDKQYSQGLYNMYKYLNSSVITTGEALEMMVNEAKAKGKLMKEGVDIFASRKAEIKKSRDEQVASAQGEHDKKAQEAKKAQQKDNNGKEVSKNDKNINQNEAKYRDFQNEGLAGAENDDSADKKDGDADDSKKDSQEEDVESDKQYQNDLKYLMDNGYTKEAATTELNKLPQYKDRIAKQQDAKKETAEKNEPKAASAPEKVKAEAQQKHPDSFIGDKYVGGNIEASKVVVKKSQDLVSNALNKESKENNNMWALIKSGLDE